jgi:hypothetical protein
MRAPDRGRALGCWSPAGAIAVDSDDLAPHLVGDGFAGEVTGTACKSPGDFANDARLERDPHARDRECDLQQERIGCTWSGDAACHADEGALPGWAAIRVAQCELRPERPPIGRVSLLACRPLAA